MKQKTNLKSRLEDSLCDEWECFCNLHHPKLIERIERMALQLNTIYNEDCLETLIRMANNSVDCVITSPPYNMRLRVRNGQYTEREWAEHFSKKYTHFTDALPMHEYRDYHTQILNELMRVSPLVFWNVQLVTGSKDAVLQIIGNLYDKIRDIVIWDKGHGQPAMNKGVLNRGYELIVIFENDGRKGRTFNKYEFERGTLQDIWRFGRGGKGEVNTHSAVFPERLVSHILNNFTKEGETIYDPFMGTGTVARVCKNLNRNYIGSEISKEYCEIAEQRLRQGVLL